LAGLVQLICVTKTVVPNYLQNFFAQMWEKKMAKYPVGGNKKYVHNFNKIFI
jgi:hypothetical protein